MSSISVKHETPDFGSGSTAWDELIGFEGLKNPETIKHKDIKQGMTPHKEGGYSFTVRTSPDTGPVYLCVKDPNDPTTTLEKHKLDLQGEIEDNGLVHGRYFPDLTAGSLYGLQIGDSEAIIADPYAQSIIATPTTNGGELRLSAIVNQNFDWGDSKRQQIDPSKRVILEAHIDAATANHPGVPEKLRGTYAGFVDKAHLDHLRKLGVTTIELQPIQQFFSNKWLRDKGMDNYWGYGTSGFFAPHSKYSSEKGPQATTDEFKYMVKTLHEAGFEVILDVVYNHTEEDHPIDALDKKGYYRTNEHGQHIDYWTGCSNTIDTSRPAGHQLVLDSLRFWVNEYQVDGFRFDLAPVILSDRDGKVDARNHPLGADIMNDPDLKDLYLSGEPWDLRGYAQPEKQLAKRGFSEWNGRFRDGVRYFWNHDDMEMEINQLPGYIYSEELPDKTINFVTAHDGFTLPDVVSYNEKHNEANGEDNRDGNDDNKSKNYGYEGHISEAMAEADPHLRGILDWRMRIARNMAATTILAMGTPMILGGDELLHTKHGNNNTWNQPELSRIDWAAAESKLSKKHLHFMKELIAIKRKSSLSVKPGQNLLYYERINPKTKELETAASPIEEHKVHWLNSDGAPMSIADWHSDKQFFGFYVAGESNDKSIVQYYNASNEPVYVTLPKELPVSGDYAMLANTDTGKADHDDTTKVQHGFIVEPRSMIVLQRLSSNLPPSENPNTPQDPRLQSRIQEINDSPGLITLPHTA